MPVNDSSPNRNYQLPHRDAPSAKDDVDRIRAALLSIDGDIDDLLASMDAVEDALDNKAPLTSPVFLNNPVAPTQPTNDVSTRLATTEHVTNKIDAVIGAAPGLLNTLDELAAALGDDANFAATTAAALAAKADAAATTAALALKAATSYVDAQIAAIQTMPPGTVFYHAGRDAPAGSLSANGAAVSRTTYAALWAAISKSATITVTIASPAVVTFTAHGFVARDLIRFATTGSLPTGITANTTYYVISTGLTTDTFRFSATLGGAAVNTSGSQSGTHTCTNAPAGFGDGSTTFNLPDLRGEFIRSWADDRAVDTGRVMGSAQTADAVVPAHSHSVSSPASTLTVDSTWRLVASRSSTTGGSASIDSGGGSGSETRPRNIALRTCIKF